MHYSRMTVNNQQKRRQCLSLGNVISNDDQVKQMSMNDLKSGLNNNEKLPDLVNKLRYYGKNLTGSDPFFYDLSTKCEAFQENLRYRSQDTQMFNLFQTFSYGDLHWKGLHELFEESAEYLDKIVSIFCQIWNF